MCGSKIGREVRWCWLRNGGVEQFGSEKSGEGSVCFLGCKKSEYDSPFCKVLQSSTHFSENGALREESFSWLSMVLQGMHRHVVG